MARLEAVRVMTKAAFPGPTSRRTRPPTRWQLRHPPRSVCSPLASARLYRSVEHRIVGRAVEGRDAKTRYKPPLGLWTDPFFTPFRVLVVDELVQDDVGDSLVQRRTFATRPHGHPPDVPFGVPIKALPRTTGQRFCARPRLRESTLVDCRVICVSTVPTSSPRRRAARSSERERGAGMRAKSAPQWRWHSARCAGGSHRAGAGGDAALRS